MRRGKQKVRRMGAERDEVASTAAEVEKMFGPPRGCRIGAASLGAKKGARRALCVYFRSKNPLPRPPPRYPGAL